MVVSVWWAVTSFLIWLSKYYPTIIIYHANSRVVQVLGNLPCIRVIVIDYDHQNHNPDEMRFILNSRSIATIQDKKFTNTKDTIKEIRKIIDDMYSKPIE